MSVENVSDFVIRKRGHNRYVESKIVEDELLEVILQKLEMVLFTTRGDTMGTAGFFMGGDLEYMLWSTELPNNIMEARIKEQVNTYVPELPAIGYTMDMKLYEGTMYDVMKLEFTINGYNINYVFEKNS